MEPHDSCARATRGLRRGEGSRQTILLARRTRTIKRCSSDARSEGQSGCSPEGEVGKTRRPSPGQMARLGVPVGGRVRTLRAVGIIPATPYKVIVRAALLGTRRVPERRVCLGRLGAGR
jgi:hypothetical protein